MTNNTLNNIYITCPNQSSIIFELTYDGKNLIRCLHKPEETDSQEYLFISIPDGIIEICASAFSHCDFIYGIVLPNTITRISSNAFQDCFNLEFVHFNNGKGDDIITDDLYISRDAFVGCMNLKESVLKQFNVCDLFKIYSDNERLETIYTIDGTKINVKRLRKEHHNHLIQMAAYYHAMGMNLTMIKGHHYDYDSYKSPAQIPGLILSELFDAEQNISVLLKQDWRFATGIGVALGYNRIRAIDVDNVDPQCQIVSTDENDHQQYFDRTGGVINEVLNLLGLPKDYPWVMKSGSSSGFHIVIEVDDIDEDFNSIAFSANTSHCFDWNGPEFLVPFFKRMELHWHNHLVLPPSLYFSDNEYKFRQTLLPSAPPSRITLSEVNKMINSFCGEVVFSPFVYKDSIEFELVEVVKQYTEYGSYGAVLSTEEKEDSISWLKACNSPDAFNSLAIRYLLGKGVKLDTHKAFDLLNKAGDLSLAHFNIASLIACGIFEGTMSDIEKHLQMIDTGFFEEKGLDVELKDKLKAIRENAVKYAKKGDLYLFFDTETTGVPRDYKAPVSNSQNWPRLVQLAWIVTDEDGNRLSSGNDIIKPDGFVIPSDAVKVHGITTAKALQEGKPLRNVLESFMGEAKQAKFFVGHNISFDQKIVGAELCRLGIMDTISTKEGLCTMKAGIDYCKIPGFYGYKYPKLQELYKKLFGVEFKDAHNAMSDIEATEKCFWALRKKNLI